MYTILFFIEVFFWELIYYKEDQSRKETQSMLQMYSLKTNILSLTIEF